MLTTQRIPRLEYYIVCGIAISYSLVFTWLSLQRYYNFMYYIDLGTHTQALYTTAFCGKLLYQNFEALNSMILSGYAYYGSYLGVHFSPLLFVLVPAFAVFPTPETLLALKSIAVGMSVIPAFLLARITFGRKTSLSLSVLYVLHPALHTLTLADFQAQAFFPLLILFTIYFQKKRRFYLQYILLAFSLMTMEFMSVLVASYLFMELLISRRAEKQIKINLLATLLFAVAWFIMANFVMAYFKPPSLSPWRSVYEIGVFQAISYRFFEKVAFLLLILIPFGFLPVGSPYILSLLPWIGITLTSSSSAMYQLGWHYGAYFLPFLYLAMLDGLKSAGSAKRGLFVRKESVNGGIGRKLLASCIIVSVILSPLNPLTTGNLPGIAYSRRPFDEEHINLINDIIDLIPDNAVVLAQTPLSQHLATRLRSYTYVPDLDLFNVEYIIGDSKHWDFTYYDFNDVVKSAINSGKFGMLAYGDGVLLLKRDYKDRPIMHRRLSGIFDYSGIIASRFPALSGNLVLGNAFVIYDSTSRSQQVIFYDAATGWGDIVWTGPGIWLLPSTYNVTFVLKVDSRQLLPEDYLLTLDVATRAGHVFAKRQVYGIDVPESGKWFNVTIPFSLDRIVDDVEFRGLNANGMNIYLDYVMLQQTYTSYEPVTSWTFNFEDLRVVQGEVVDNVISHQKGNGTLFFSPIVTLLPGDYTAHFWLRLDSNATGHVIDLEVSRGTESLAMISINAEYFSSVGSWQSFKVEFALGEETVVQFVGARVEEIPLSVLLVEVGSGTA